VNQTLFTKLLILIVSLFFLQQWVVEKSHGFTLLSIKPDVAYNLEWEIDPLPHEEMRQVESILSQKFHYLTRGGQAYVFVSEDGEYVIKFFKQRIHLLGKYFFSHKRIDKLHAKSHRDRMSYKLAFEALRDRTALIYFHANQTANLETNFVLVDKVPIEHQMDLNQYAFCLQKRVVPSCEYLTRLIQEGELDKAKEAVTEIIALSKDHLEKGIVDGDSRVLYNIGFINDKAILLDAGQLKRVNKDQYAHLHQVKIKELMRPLTLFFEKNSPELATYVKEQVDAL